MPDLPQLAELLIKFYCCSWGLTYIMLYVGPWPPPPELDVVTLQLSAAASCLLVYLWSMGWNVVQFRPLFASVRWEIYKIQLHHERPDVFCFVSVKILHLENELVRILVRTPSQVSLVHFYSKSFDSQRVLRVAVIQPLPTSLESCCGTAFVN